MTVSATLPAVNQHHRLGLAPIATPDRLLLGPGPSNAHPTVLQALARTPIGHLDPLYIDLMGEVQELLRYAWQTDNRLTLPMSGTGSAAMEATLANMVEPGDTVLVAIKGYFGHRLADMAGRYGAHVVTIERRWGEAFELAEIEQALIQHRPAVLAMVHAETSTGVCQPMQGVGALCREHDCLLLLDTVTSLGGVPLFLDAWQVDLAYSCSQKGLSCPPGLGPFTMGPRAEAKLAARRGPVPNWYLDVSLLNKYWGSDRVYHHTAPVNMNFGMREALRLLAEEGLDNAWARHRRNAERLWQGLEDLGLVGRVHPGQILAGLTVEYAVAPGERPETAPWIRLRLASGEEQVVTLRLRPLRIEQRALLQAADGTRTMAELAALDHGIPTSQVPAALAAAGRQALLRG